MRYAKGFYKSIYRHYRRHQKEVKKMTIVIQGFGKQDLLSLGKGLLIAEGAAILTTAALWLQAGKLDLHSLLVLEAGAVVSTLINSVRKSVDGVKE